MYLRFLKYLYFMPDESLQQCMNKDYLLTYLLKCWNNVAAFRNDVATTL